MNKLNILKPDLSNLYFYIYTGLFFITVSIIDVFLYAFFNINITSFLPSTLSFILPLILGLIGLHFIRIEFSGVRSLDLLNKNIFIQGGAGGVGTIAIQLFNHWGCNVSTTCSSKNIKLLKRLGANEVIDYQKDKFYENLEDQDLVYDLLGDSVLENSIEKCTKILKNQSSSHYISLTHPFINTIDNKGLLLGVPHAILIRQKLKAIYRPINIHWSIYRPSLSGLQELTYLSEEEIIKPTIDSIYTLSDISMAHKKVATGHGSGKVVIRHDL